MSAKRAAALALACSALCALAACGDGRADEASTPVDLARLRGAPLRPAASAQRVPGATAASEPLSASSAEVATSEGAPPEADAMRPPPLSEQNTLAASAPASESASESASEPAPSSESKPERSSDELAIAKDYRELDFALLSNFEYRQPTAKEWQADPEAVRNSGAKRIPPELLALSGTKVAIEGFMNPIDFDREGVKSFALVHNSIGCCFGMFPRMNEWVSVVMTGDRKAEFYSVEPATVYGVFEVGEEFEGAYVVSLFRIKADHVFGTF
jgi:hypothetical protein